MYTAPNPIPSHTLKKIPIARLPLGHVSHLAPNVSNMDTHVLAYPAIMHARRVDEGAWSNKWSRSRPLSVVVVPYTNGPRLAQTGWRRRLLKTWVALQKFSTDGRRVLVIRTSIVTSVPACSPSRHSTLAKSILDLLWSTACRYVPF